MTDVPPLPDPDALLVVGRVGRPHGVRGEVYVDLHTDRTDRLDPGARLWCRDRWLVVERSRPVSDRWLVAFEGISDRDLAARLTTADLSAPPIDDDPDALWVHELIGSEVVDADGVRRGTCVSVIHNPADDLLELDSGALVPVTFVVDTVVGTIIIDPPAGLFDLFDSTDEDR